MDWVYKTIVATVASGATLIAVALIVLFLYPSFRLVLADCFRFLRFLGSSVQKKILESEFEGSINSFGANLNSQFSEKIVPACSIKWVTKADQAAYLTPGRAIVKLSCGPDHDINYFNAAKMYVETGLLNRTKPYLNATSRHAIDLLVIKELLSKTRRNVLRVFNQNFTEENIALREKFYKLEDIEQSGTFTRIFIQELYYMGESLSDQVPRIEHESETENFFDWMHNLATREEGAKTALRFFGNHIKVGVILIADYETYNRYGIDAYLRRANFYASDGYGGIYLLSRGHRSDLTKKIAKALVATECFEITNKDYDIARVQENGEILTLTCIAIRPLTTTIIQKAWEKLHSAYLANNLITGIVIAVAHDSIDVNVYGLKVNLTLSQLSSLRIEDARKYFRYDNELYLNVVNCDASSETIELSNVDTQTDPKTLINLRLAENAVFKAIVVRTIVVDGHRQVGLQIDSDDGKITGFVPRSKATFSHFDDLTVIWPTGSIVKAVIEDFDVEHANYVCHLEGIRDPWLSTDEFPVDKIANVTIRQINERYITCELIPGLEGIIAIDELGWSSEDVQTTLGMIHVGQEIKALITQIGDSTSRRPFRLSKKRMVSSPVAEYAHTQNDAIVMATVKSIHAEGFLLLSLADSKHNACCDFSEVTWDFLSKDINLPVVGAQVQVRIIGYNERSNEVRVSIKRISPNHFKSFTTKHQIGDIVSGIVRKQYADHYLIEIQENTEITQAYVYRSELTFLTYVDDTNIDIFLEIGKTYSFTVKRIFEYYEIIELSRKEFLRQNGRNLKYGGDDCYAVVIDKKVRSVMVQSDGFEAYLTTEDIRRYHLRKKIVVRIARINSQSGNPEIQEIPIGK